MADRMIIADASRVSGAEFFRSLFGGEPRDRAAEAEYLRVINEHWAAAKAESAAMVKAEGETELAFLIRKLAPIYAHEAWEREQAKAWARGTWEAAPAERRAA
jgi:hypothetical protein